MISHSRSCLLAWITVSISWHWVLSLRSSCARPSCLPAFPEKACSVLGDPSSINPIFPLVFLAHVLFIGVNDFMSSRRVFDGCFFLVSRVVLMVSFHVVGMWFIRSSYSSLEKSNFFLCCASLLPFSVSMLFTGFLIIVCNNGHFRTLFDVVPGPLT